MKESTSAESAIHSCIVSLHYDGQRDVPTRSARDGVASANAGEHFPKRIENATHRCFYRLEIVVVNMRLKHLSLGRRMFAIRFQMNAEVLVVFGIFETVVFL